MWRWCRDCCRSNCPPHPPQAGSSPRQAIRRDKAHNRVDHPRNFRGNGQEQNRQEDRGDFSRFRSERGQVRKADNYHRWGKRSISTPSQMSLPSTGQSLGGNLSLLTRSEKSSTIKKLENLFIWSQKRSSFFRNLSFLCHIVSHCRPGFQIWEFDQLVRTRIYSYLVWNLSFEATRKSLKIPVPARKSSLQKLDKKFKSK